MGMPTLGRMSESIYDSKKIIEGNPNPYNFIILDKEEVNGNLVVKVRYPDANNYEGVKILVYKNYSISELNNRLSLDPHFSKNGLSPACRFEPTERGWKIACFVAKYI